MKPKVIVPKPIPMNDHKNSIASKLQMNECKLDFQDYKKNVEHVQVHALKCFDNIS